MSDQPSLPATAEPPAAAAAVPTDAELVRALPVAIELLRSQRSADVPAGHIDAYVARDWMRWAAGRLIVTVQGQAVRDGANADAERPR